MQQPELIYSEAYQLLDQGQVKDAYRKFVSAIEASAQQLYNVNYIHRSIVSNDSDFQIPISVIRSSLHHLEDIAECKQSFTTPTSPQVHSDETPQQPSPLLVDGVHTSFDYDHTKNMNSVADGLTAVDHPNGDHQDSEVDSDDDEDDDEDFIRFNQHLTAHGNMNGFTHKEGDTFRRSNAQNKRPKSLSMTYPNPPPAISYSPVGVDVLAESVVDASILMPAQTNQGDNLAPPPSPGAMNVGGTLSNYVPHIPAPPLLKTHRQLQSRLNELEEAAAGAMVSKPGTRIHDTKPHQSNSPLLSQTKQLASDNCVDSVSQLSATIAETRETLNRIRTLYMSAATIPDIMQFPPYLVAYQLTLIDSAIFRRIPPHALLTHSPRTPHPRIVASTDFFNYITRVIEHSILLPQEVSRRAELVNRWIKIAVQCLSLNNYQTLKAIISALGTPPIQRLCRTWDCIPKKRMAKLEHLSSLMSETDNYGEYRLHMRFDVKKHWHRPVVPFLGVFIHDMTYLLAAAVDKDDPARDPRVQTVLDKVRIFQLAPPYPQQYPFTHKLSGSNAGGRKYGFLTNAIHRNASLVKNKVPALFGADSDHPLKEVSQISASGASTATLIGNDVRVEQHLITQYLLMRPWVHEKLIDELSVLREPPRPTRNRSASPRAPSTRSNRSSYTSSIFSNANSLVRRGSGNSAYTSTRSSWEDEDVKQQLKSSSSGAGGNGGIWPFRKSPEMVRTMTLPSPESAQLGIWSDEDNAVESGSATPQLKYPAQPSSMRRTSSATSKILSRNCQVMEHYPLDERETRLIHTDYRSLQKCFGCIHLRIGSALACSIIAGISFYLAVISFQNSSPFYSYLQQAPLSVFGVANLFLGVVALFAIAATYLDVYEYILVVSHALYVAIGAVLIDQFVNAILFIVYRGDYTEWCITTHFENFGPVLSNITASDTTADQHDFYNCDRTWQDELKFGFLAFFMMASFYIYCAICFLSYRVKRFIRLSILLGAHSHPQYHVPVMPPMVSAGVRSADPTGSLAPDPMIVPPQGGPLQPPMMRSDRPNVIVLNNERPATLHHCDNSSPSATPTNESTTDQKRASQLANFASSRPASLPRANFNINYENYTIYIPNFTFGKPTLFPGSGGLMGMAIGRRLQDDHPVVVKLSPYATRLEREYYIAHRLLSQPDGKRYSPTVVDLVSLAKDGLTALIYLDQTVRHIPLTTQRLFSHYRLTFDPPPPFPLLHETREQEKESASMSSPETAQLHPETPGITITSTLREVGLFLEFAIEACSCLQLLHANGIMHGEIRPSAFYWWFQEGKIRAKIINYGSGLRSYEDLLLTSSGWRRAVMAAAAHDDLLDDPTILDGSGRNIGLQSSRNGFQNALAYVSPEQTGRTSYTLDHRTDLYSLGIMFFEILTGQAPFEGSPMSIIQAVLSQNVPLVHTLRPDVPPVLSLIIDKLTRKVAVDDRYNSVYGVREDLIECLRRFKTDANDSLLFFPLGLHDINSVFQFPSTVYGRDPEIELLRAAIRRSAMNDPTDDGDSNMPSVSVSTSSGRVGSAPLPHDKPSSEILLIVGPGGVGKSTVVSAVYNYARQYGYLGTYKFDSSQKRPYNGLLQCLSSVLRQLLTEPEAVIQDFYEDLKAQLGPHFSNLHLIVSKVPELKPILNGHHHHTEEDEDMLAHTESRFHAVFLTVLRTIARKKPITLFLDDLTEADDSSLHLLANIIDFRLKTAKILFIVSCRDMNKLPDSIRDRILVSDGSPVNSQVTVINLAPLDVNAIHQLVSQSLHRCCDATRQLGDIIFHRTYGNPFYAKQFMLMMKRKGDIWFDWEDKEWKFRLDNMGQNFSSSRSASSTRISSNGHNNTANITHSEWAFSAGVLDVEHIVSYLKEMDQPTQTLLTWASLMGNVFDFRQIKCLMMTTSMPDEGAVIVKPSMSDVGDSVSTNSTLETAPAYFVVEELVHASARFDEENAEEINNPAMAGLQNAVHEGVLQLKFGTNNYQFTHDRYYQAATMLVNEQDREKMHLRIGQMLMVNWDGDADDIFVIADHLVKSADLIKLFKDRKKYIHVLCKAGEEAVDAGALRVGHTYYSCAMRLMPDNPWGDADGDTEECCQTRYRETLDLYLRMAELDWGINRRQEARRLIEEIMAHTMGRPIERARAWRIQARFYFQLQQHDLGINAITDALSELGVEDIFAMDEPLPLPTERTDSPTHIQQLYVQVKQQILGSGLEGLVERERCKDRRVLAIMSLLGEACMGAYWLSPHLVDLISIKLVQLSLEHGMGTTSGSGFTWLGCTAVRFKEYRLAARLGEVGVAISEKFSGNPDIAQALVVHHALLSQFSDCHYRDCIVHFERAYKYAVAGGDKTFSAMALFQISTVNFYTGANLIEVQRYLMERIEECADGERDLILTLNISLWRTVLCLEGKLSIDHNNDSMLESTERSGSRRAQLFLETIRRYHLGPDNGYNWHWSLKIIVLVHFDRFEEAVKIGHSSLDKSAQYPNHKHIGNAIFYHTIAMIAMIRDATHLDQGTKEEYMLLVEKNRKSLGEWGEYSYVNYRMYQKLVEAEICTLTNDPNAIRFYNEALEIGLEGRWYPFSAYCYQLIAEHYIRCGMKMVAKPLLQKALEIYSGLDAWGVVRHFENKYSRILKDTNTNVEAVDAAVQTDEQDFVGHNTTPIEQSVWLDQTQREQSTTEEIQHGSRAYISEDAILSLDIVDLMSIIKSSQGKLISNEMNSFDELLKKMMGIIMANSAAELGAIVIKEGVFGIAAHAKKSGCETYKSPIPLTDDMCLISTLVVHYVIHTQTVLFIPNTSEDTRFTTGSWFARTGPKSVICIPCIHKNTLVGVLYLQASPNTFTPKHVTVLDILCHQIGISITNALLFKSVQKATQVNARMIVAQREALEEARESREQALKATEIKSNFLANMSHELRTPFSGFYGMIDLLSETRLDPEQREFVSIAKQSCEMLLQIIDDLLDFSKLEAHKVKLHPGLFYVEDLVQDRVELLITLACNKKLELTCFTDADVPPIIYGDGNRIGQILMNLIGNAVKFTQHGEVVVRCSVDKEPIEPALSDDELVLRFSVQDTGIGMKEEEIKSLFVPFSQVDGSTTRNFGGTGLGLSICLELVQLMGGDIWVESQENVGSTFYFRVRVMKPSTLAEPEVDSGRRNREIQQLTKLIGQPRILLDTSERQAQMITSLIPSMIATRVAGPAEAAQLAAGEEPKSFDCIIVDNPLPEKMRHYLRHMEQGNALQKVHMILLYAPAIESIRRQIVGNKLIRGDDLQTHKTTDARVTRITKPVRRFKLLQTMLNVLGLSPTYTAVSETSGLEATDQRSRASLATDKVLSQQRELEVMCHERIPADVVTATGKLHAMKPSYSYPYAAGQRRNEGFTPEELAIFQGQRILVAEDNPVAQKLLVKQLSRLGFVVETCNNGFECIETWIKRGPHYFSLAWVDHHMPGCDGIEATKKIRWLENEMNEKDPIPIIALTGK
ncbi:hypothetical protein BX666DRAFT_2026165 [Dichotomocladium elegans]|nr:hypothetical protein BX666DRAFT_2026165 [Dichotomocladium elegans]